MNVTQEQITCTAPQRKPVILPRGMVEEAIHRLVTNRRLDVDEVHLKITKRNKVRTDKLMAVLGMLPDVSWDSFPKRVLYYRREN